jgi:plasmid stabilization system protein ParE
MDLARADRDVAAAAADLQARGSTVDWDLHRHVSGQRGLREIESQSGPLRDALVRWVEFLTVARVSQLAEQRRDAKLAEARAIVRLERDAEVDLRGIVAGLVRARSPGEARAWLAALPEAAAPMREPEHTARETREEAFRRLGIANPSERFLGVAESALVVSARDFIASTNDLAREVSSRKAPWPLDLEVRLARAAKEGWPARLSWRTAAELVPGLQLRANVTGEPPDALGAASFARALGSIGEVFHRSTRHASEPFSVREPPLDPRPMRAGLVLASALGERALHGRVLGLAPGRAADQARDVAASFLLSARFDALRVAQRAGDFEELTARVLGAALLRSMSGAWPPARDVDLARMLATFGALEVIDAVREREGDDWFRNPRAFATLRDLSSPPVSLADGAASRLARRFEEALG